MIGGRYLVGSMLGKGGHGEVYRARDTIDQHDIAIKFLAHRLAQDTAYRLRLVREARAMTALSGMATVQVHGVIGADDGTPCVVMELLEGEDLADAIERRTQDGAPFSVREVVAIFVPIVQTLDAAHARGIVHRDIKPSNVFLVEGTVHDTRIMDFGLAKTGDLSSITADQMLAGSPSYIAPEIWRAGARDADRRCDAYSLACVIYKTFTGQVPIHRDGLAELLIAVTSAPRPSLHAARPDLPPEVDDWLAQALAIDPNQRFQTVVAMWRAFRSVVGA
jgi:serine/threonine-protein kinase